MIRTSYFTLLLIAFLSGCADRSSTSENKSDEYSGSQTNTLLPGLWSMDSSSILSNTGFFLQPDGRMEPVGYEASGNWSLKGNDTLELRSNSASSESISSAYKIVSISADRMILSGTDGEHLYRKVPFGLANQEEVLTGYIGTLSSKQPDRIHDAVLPSVKKIALRLVSADTTLRLELLQGERNFSPAPAIEWRGILVAGGKFELRLSSTQPKKLSETGSEYELKVLGY